MGYTFLPRFTANPLFGCQTFAAGGLTCRAAKSRLNEGGNRTAG